MFNLPQGGEIIVILLLALVILGPEKLPDVIRRVGKTYAELKKLGQGFQDEFKSVIDEPAREMRETANLLRTSIDTSFEPATKPGADTNSDASTDMDSDEGETRSDAGDGPRLRPADDPPHGEPTTDLPTFTAEAVSPVTADPPTDGTDGDADPEARSA